MLVFKAKTERHYKQTWTSARPRTRSAVSLPGGRPGGVADPEVQLNAIKFPKNFKDLTRERLRMNARLEVKKDPKVWPSRPSSRTRSR